MLTNGQAGMGYTAEDYVPNLPVSIRKGGNNFEVFDSRDYWLATFRNITDSKRYIKDITNRVKKMQKGWDDNNNQTNVSLCQCHRALDTPPYHVTRRSEAR